ncbi:MAG TPA: diguanylate cyclase, partial [Gammaproteobacteria bacterium]|nr:diguanylate cyclase [Gammaproteobacteria bacterium]
MEGLSENRENQQVIEAISEKAHRFGQTTIASGINDAESLSVLWGLGVDLVQGDFLQETTIEMNYDFTAMMA